MQGRGGGACMISGWRDVPELRTYTVLRLSHKNWTCDRNHVYPQTLSVTTIGTSSKKVMVGVKGKKFQDWQNLSSRHNAPKPYETVASEAANKSGRGLLAGDRKTLIPLHSSKKEIHHGRSRRNSMLSRIGWQPLRKQHSRLIIRRRKVQPGLTTLQAWWKGPITYSVHEELPFSFDTKGEEENRYWEKGGRLNGPASRCYFNSTATYLSTTSGWSLADIMLALVNWREDDSR